MQHASTEARVHSQQSLISFSNGSFMASTQKTRLDLKIAAAAAVRERLRQGLPLTVERLKFRQADQIADSDIDAYVGLNWLEWQGGGLRLTITGKNVCAQMTAPSAV
jgi:predicted RNase H-like nuclease